MTWLGSLQRLSSPIVLAFDLRDERFWVEICHGYGLFVSNRYCDVFQASSSSYYYMYGILRGRLLRYIITFLASMPTLLHGGYECFRETVAHHSLRLSIEENVAQKMGNNSIWHGHHCALNQSSSKI